MLKHLYHFLIALLLPVLAASCTDDLATQDLPDAAPGKGIVRLSVPGTRSIPTNVGEASESDATEQERAIRDLWFLAYPTANGQDETVIQRLNTQELTHNYQTFSIEMPFGTYQVYVVANIDGLSTAITEDELNDIILYYKEGENLVLPDPTKGLPMFYKHAEDFTVNAQGGTIKADLEFCCVKVSYTLLFNNEESGCSHNAFGDNYLLINSVDGRNIATQAKLVPDYKPIADMELMYTENNALSGQYAEGDYDTSAPEATFSTLSKPQNDHNWVYRGTFYLPEHYVSSNDEQSQIVIDAVLYDAQDTKKADVQYTIELGEDLNTEDKEAVRQLPRARYYDITGRITSLGDKIETTVAVQDWKLVELDTELESPYHLWVQQTEIERLVAGTAVTIPCRTDAPVLEAYSPTIEIKDENGNITLSNRDIYIVTFNDDYTAFTVQINPTIPPSTTWDKQYNHILIRIPDPETGEYLLSKRIDIKEVSTEPYFVVTPPQYIIRINDISNLPEHKVTFSYETNLTNVEVKCEGSDVTNTGITWTKNEHVTLTDSGLENGKGTVTVTLDAPYNPANYTRTQTLTLDYTATDSRNPEIKAITAHTTVTIIPNAQTYRLHFRPVNDDWDNPHIYVYEPLYAPDGKEVLREWWNSSIGADEQENALLYGFTGGVTFKGWSTQGGTESWPNNSTLKLDGNRWLANNVGAGTWNPLNTDNKDYQLGSVYDYSIDYCPSFREGCCATFDAENKNNHHNIKWPGVKMKEDPDNDNWFYFDLPALASPGTTLIMFADGHSEPTGSDEYIKQHRYPAHLVPGVPLYDYADKDGWFLYDPDKGDQNEFVDDKPEVITYTYRIYVNATNRGTRIHVWEVGGQDFTIWNDPSGDLKTDTEGKKYFEFTLSSPEDKQIGYKFMNDSSDSFIEVSEWIQVTEKDYDYEYTIN